MRVAGTRADGALWLSLDGGMSVILRGDTCSPPMDPTEAEAMGPWQDAHGVSGSDRRELGRRLDRAATRPVQSFALDRKVKVSATQGKKKMAFEYTVTGEDDVIGDKPTDEPAADDAPKAEPDDPTAVPADKKAAVIVVPITPEKDKAKKDDTDADVEHL